MATEVFTKEWAQAVPFTPRFVEQKDDPLAITHITDWLPDLKPIESSYKAKSGALPLEGAFARPKGKSPDSVQDMQGLFVHDADRLLIRVTYYGHPTSVGVEVDENGEWQFRPLWGRRAGPRQWIYFPPKEVKAAIVTCGGLCPGINDVIRQIVYTLDVYGVEDILGVQYGFKGFVDPSLPPVKLSRKIVHDINMHGGSFLGVSRGHPKNTDIVDALEAWGVNMLFVIGGNGSHAGANCLYEICRERKLKVVIVGVPKTIDNDIMLVDKTFGFDTAVEEAQRAINAAYVEAASAYNGIGIVKLMGRQSGFIAMHATIANGQVDVVLIPEVPFVMEGKQGVLEFMKARLALNGNCVVVIAEGAGQDLIEGTGGVDASGNPILGDVGKWFTQKVKAYFKECKTSADVKYIDPTYMIRARPPISSDHILCTILGQNAVHGAFAGYSNITIGMVNTHYALLPIPAVIKQPRTVDPDSNMWHRCVTCTGQPEFCAMPNPEAPSGPPVSEEAAALKAEAAVENAP
eukprot:TRINITY_DN23834_c0_g1_i1.p1 TRINITY_DN23834_c0_g1~~TRINITY_DN23834_c0_g1_i1.p1  ORF type:complete len:519 (+),score=119.52 TRINITY_DN23834_c0_g1_i1:131-1687(+)